MADKTTSRSLDEVDLNQICTGLIVVVEETMQPGSHFLRGVDHGIGGLAMMR